jgi:hypothetical protein
LFKKFTNIQSAINNIERVYIKPAITYNPIKYIRGAKLLDGNINYNQVISVKNEKGGNKVDFTYEDYKNSLKEKKQQPGLTPNPYVNPYANKVNRDVNPDSFSYEQYMKQKGVDSNPYISKDDGANSNTDYIVDKMLNPDNNISGYLNFDTKSEKVNLSQTVLPEENTVYNPYNDLKLNEFKPVYKPSVHSDFNNFNNQFSNANIGVTPSVHNMSIPSLTDLNKDKFKYNDSKFPK